MKWRLFYALLALFGCLSGSRAATVPGPVVFSHPHGFYETPFELVLRAGIPSPRVRFTLDGTAPDASRGQDYTGPIPVNRTTVVRASALATDGATTGSVTHTYLFPRDIVNQSSDGLPPAGFPYEWGDNRVDYGMDPDVVNDPRYRAEMAPALKSLPSLSLVMDLDDLFDRRRGIYANAREDGREAERPASLELIPANGGPGFQINCGTRIRGGFSRMPNNAKHGFRFFFRQQYGTGKLKYPVFGPDAAQSFDGFDLRCSQNYSWSMGGDPRGLFIRDQFSRDTQLALGQPAARGDFHHLYINGQYWGLYDTCERPEASFGKAYFGGDKEDYDVIKIGIGALGMDRMRIGATDGTMDAWKRLYLAAKAGLSNNAAFFKLLGRNPDGTENRDFDVLLDPVNLIDYMLVIFYGGNLDSPVTRFGGNQAPNNWYGLRNRHARAGFKFFIWDAEHTLLDVNEDRTGPYPAGRELSTSNPQWLWQQCLENAEFRQLFADRVHRHLGPGGVLSPEVTRRRMEKRLQEIESAVVCESARWGDVATSWGFGGGNGGRTMRRQPDGTMKPVPRTRDVEWRAEVKRVLTEYVPQRTEIVRAQLWRFGLIPELAPPEFGRAGGRVPAGSDLALRASEGQITYTTDGADPRAIGGGVGVTAARYQSPLRLSGKTTIKARAFLGGEWSALAEAVFEPAAP